MGILWSFLPDSFLPLVVAGTGLALMIGFINRRTAGRILGMLILSLILGPFIEALMSGLPGWLSLLITLFTVMAALRALLVLFLGRAAAAHCTGILAADCIRFSLGLFLLPFRILGRAFRRD